MSKPGSQSCTIPLRGDKRGVSGQCGVTVISETVYFYADWSGQDLLDGLGTRMPTLLLRDPRTGSAVHIWEVVTKNGQVRSVKQSGARLPPT